MSENAQLAVRVMLGLLMISAGVAKRAAGERWIAQARGLAVPGPVAVAVPFAEMGVGAALVAADGPVPAIVTAVLLVAFSSLLVANLARGRRPPCACFGGFRPRPISWWSVARNAVLLAASVAVAASA